MALPGVYSPASIALRVIGAPILSLNNMEKPWMIFLAITV
jgi:hypothetical protein